MARLITISWRDIPAQVIAREGRNRAARPLSDRFQIAIDRAAVRAGKDTTDDYLSEWRQRSEVCGPDLETEAAIAAAGLEARFSDDVLAGYVTNGGFAPARSSESEIP